MDKDVMKINKELAYEDGTLESTLMKMLLGALVNSKGTIHKTIFFLYVIFHLSLG